MSWKANVHHTAHVELSVIQKGVNVGAHTSIRNSFIGEGAQIGEGARIFGSVIGKGAFVGTNAIVFGSVVYPEAFAAQFIMQASLLGWRAAVFTTSTFFDVNFARNVRVAHKGGFADSGVTFLGACVGPNARVAAGVWVGSGREIPSGALVIKPPGRSCSGSARSRRALPTLSATAPWFVSMGVDSIDCVATAPIRCPHMTRCDAKCAGLKRPLLA